VSIRDSEAGEKQRAPLAIGISCSHKHGVPTTRAPVIRNLAAVVPHRVLAETIKARKRAIDRRGMERDDSQSRRRKSAVSQIQLAHLSPSPD